MSGDPRVLCLGRREEVGPHLRPTPNSSPNPLPGTEDSNTPSHHSEPVKLRDPPSDTTSEGRGEVLERVDTGRDRTV